MHALFVLVFTALLTLLLPAGVFAQGAQSGERKRADAVRVADGAIRVDGRLDDRAWQDVPVVTDFVQKEPVEGAKPTDLMEVRLAYDDNALYVGARMSSTGSIQAPLGRRDNGGQSEYFVVLLDTYLDRRTAASFGVTAAGVRLDSYFAADNDDGESDYDPVWVARTSVEESGWTAEMWIPFSQLRFSDIPSQTWGLNIKRWIPSRNEEVHWALIRRTDQGLASRFGDLQGIEGIHPRRRVELLPYVASNSNVVGAPNAANPFSERLNASGRVGADAKIGFGSNLTLDATINPDFGQVEADPAEVNLTGFETFFNEKRPFFVEGAKLLNGTDDNWFYSRRIGAPPIGPATGDFVDYPQTSTILGAAKLTGRLASGTSIGMLGAVTGDETARTFKAGQPTAKVSVAPTTSWGAARVQKEFGLPGSLFGVQMTNVHREFGDGDLLASFLARNAVTMTGDSVIRMDGGNYELQLYGGLSRIDGQPGAIDRLQRTNARYLQRPDASYLQKYDPLRTSLSGTKSGWVIQRRNAKHWQWQQAMDIESPELELNEIGRLNSGDGYQPSARLEYHEFTPARFWRRYYFILQNRNEWNFGGDLQSAQFTPTVTVAWKNFWQTQVDGVFTVRSQDERLTRGGPSMQKPSSKRVNLRIQSSDAAQTRGNVRSVYMRTEDGGLDFQLNGQITVQPSPQWQLSVQPSYERLVDTQQYVTTLGGGRAITFGSRYVFANVDRSTYSTQFRLNYTFKPDLTLDFYGEPFAASGRFSQYGELAVPRTRLRRVYGADGTTVTTLADGSLAVSDGASTFTLRNRDFNVQSFRSNLVLRWEWRVGSTLYLVWSQNRATQEVTGARVSLADMFGSISQRGDNFFAIKASFWLSPR
jgi:hypothetical protein